MTRNLQPSLTVLTAYNGEGKSVDEYMTRCKLQAKKCRCRDACETNVRYASCSSSSLREYPDGFEGIGKFDGAFHITTDPSITPVVHAPRKCPIQLRDEIQTELQDMENIGVIAKVTTPTEWASSIVCSRKSSDKLRICLDPKDLNEAIRRPH